MENTPQATGRCPSISPERRPRNRHKRVGRRAPQAATCLLAATVLVAVPAGPGQAAPTGSAPRERPRPQLGAAIERTRIDAATMRKVKAYRKYRRKISRQQEKARTAVGFARRQIGKPYGWGATGPNAYDCSGLVMKSWDKAGVRLPRVTYSQYRAVPRKVGMNSLKPGDLVFFHNLGHVGMVVSENRYVHAPNRRSRIRIDRLSGYRKRAFAGAVRPGAPSRKSWPDYITKLAEQLDHGALAAGQENGESRDTEPRPRRPRVERAGFVRRNYAWNVARPDSERGHARRSSARRDGRGPGRQRPEPRPASAPGASSTGTSGLPRDTPTDGMPEFPVPGHGTPPDMEEITG
jgi:cell wall-associated NlpC family hydrolase